MEAAREQTQKELGRTRMLKFAVTLLSYLLTLFIKTIVVYVSLRDPTLLQEFLGRRE